MTNCGTVSMNRYWSYIATPLFFAVISFGVYTLFTVKDIQVVGKDDISKTVQMIKDAAAAAAAPATAPPTPHGLPRVVAEGAPEPPRAFTATGLKAKAAAARAALKPRQIT